MHTHIPRYLNWALPVFTPLAWPVIYMCALNCKETNTAFKSGKNVVDTCSTAGYQSLPQYHSCRTHVWYSHYCAPLGPAIIHESQQWSCPAHSLQNWGQRAALQRQSWSFPSHLTPATVCSCACICPWSWSVLCFQGRCLYQRWGRAFSNIFSWAQERWGANDLGEVEAMFFLA